MADKNEIANGILGRTNTPEFYKSLLDDMLTFVGVLDKTGTIIFANNTPLILAGITLDEVIGKKFWDTP